MSRKRAILIASFTIDIIRIGDHVYERIGGPAYYSGLTMKMLGLDPVVITALGSHRKRVIEMLSAHDDTQDLDIMDSDPDCDSLYTFHHLYIGTSRSSEILRLGCRIRIEDALSKVGEDPEWVLVSPVFREVAPKEIARLALTRYIALDLQGYAREIENHRVRSSLNSIERNTKDLSRIKITHLSSDDVNEANNKSMDLEKLSFLADKTDIVLYTEGVKGGYLGLTNKDHENANKQHGSKITWYYIPPYTEAEKGDPTGCGDIFLASMVSNIILGKDAIDSAIIASITSGMRVSRGFPMKMDPIEIEKIARALREKVYTLYNIQY